MPPKDVFGPGFGKRLKAFRNAAGLTQRELSLRAGYDQVSLSRVETNEITPRMDTVMRLSSALRLSASEFQELAQGKGEASPRALEESPRGAELGANEPADLGQLWKAIALIQSSLAALSQAHAALKPAAEIAAEREAIVQRLEKRLDRVEGEQQKLTQKVVSLLPPQRKASGSKR
jgi:transcriptional regulator with XRE-family HTH domain